VKQGVTSITSTFLRLKAERFVPTRDLVIVFTGDEESFQHTTEDLAKNHRDLVDAEYALNSDGGGGTLDENGKPLVFNFQTAEKSYADFELTVTNPGGHSSLPRADNAIYELADALKKVQAYEFQVMSNDTTLAYFAILGKTAAGEEGQAMLRFSKNPQDQEAAKILAGTSYVGMTRTTCVATTLRGGHAPNALPQSATANVNCRIFPGVSVEGGARQAAGARGRQCEDRDDGKSDVEPGVRAPKGRPRGSHAGRARELPRRSGRAVAVVRRERRYLLPRGRHSDLRCQRDFHQGERRVRPRPERAPSSGVLLQRARVLALARDRPGGTPVTRARRGTRP
jgi:acetylornithine deacetylase/succinyl-diaminopimelate desuccinylase-like protein